MGPWNHELGTAMSSGWSSICFRGFVARVVAGGGSVSSYAALGAAFLHAVHGRVQSDGQSNYSLLSLMGGHGGDPKWKEDGF